MMTENKLKIAFFKTNTGKKVLKILQEYKKQTQEIVELSQQLSQYKEIVNKQNKDIITPEMEKETKELMENVTSLFFSQQPKKYLFSVSDEEGNVTNIYDIEELEKEILAYE